jgi:Transposase DDE domain group 1
VLRDLAVMLADGGDCLRDLAALRDQPALIGRVASTPTAWRVLDRIARDADGPARLPAARAHARARAWAAGDDPQVELLVIAADATLVLPAATTRRRGRHLQAHLRFAPLPAYLDRGAAPGKPLAGILRPGNTPAGASDDPTELVDLALAQLPAAATATLPVLVRSDSAGASSKLAWHLRDRRVGESINWNWTPESAGVVEALWLVELRGFEPLASCMP